MNKTDIIEAATLVEEAFEGLTLDEIIQCMKETERRTSFGEKPHYVRDIIIYKIFKYSEQTNQRGKEKERDNTDSRIKNIKEKDLEHTLPPNIKFDDSEYMYPKFYKDSLIFNKIFKEFKPTMIEPFIVPIEDRKLYDETHDQINQRMDVTKIFELAEAVLSSDEMLELSKKAIELLNAKKWNPRV